MSATSSPASIAGGIVNFATGKVDPSSNVACVVTLGFTPRHVVVINEDLVVRWEKMEGMAAAACWKTVTAGTSTYDTNSGIVLAERGFTISAAAMGDGDNVMYAAWG